MKRAATITISLSLAAAALGAACGGDGSSNSVGPSGKVGPDAAIAFVGRRPDQPSTDLYLIDADSGAVQQLTDTQEAEWWPTWSRDRRLLGYVTTPLSEAGDQSTATPVGTATPEATPTPEDISQRHLVVANADGTDQRPIGDSIPIQSYSGGFSWSPGDSQIFYTSLVDPTQRPLRGKLRLVNVADGSDVPLPEERLGYLPVWSPDGTKVLFGAFVGPLDERGKGESELFLMDSDRSNVRQITDRPGTDVDASWSPDGTRIVWWGLEPQSDPTQTATPQLFMMDVASGQITQLGEGMEPAWSPDGQQILFIVQEKPPTGTFSTQPNTDIYVLDVGTGERRALAPHTARDLSPTWSPDGRRIAFVSTRDSLVGEIYVINADGSDLRRLTDNKLTEAMLAWAAP